MLNILFWFSLGLSALNWLVFAALTLFKDVPALNRLLNETLRVTPPHKGLEAAELPAVDLNKLAATIGSLANAFSRAGSTPTAAALSVFFALIAALCAGIGAFSH
jgi:hypothetical protein